MKKVTIVILNWNGVCMMRRFLPSVVQNSPDAEVVVVDNGSSDDSIQYLETEMPQVRIVKLDRNYGFAEGYHRGLKEIESEYYLLLNSDVEVREGWLQPMLTYMDAHTEVAVCQPKLLCQWAPEYFEYAGASGGFIDAYGYPYCRGRVFSTVEKDEGQYDDISSVLWATGAALLIRSADYWAVGGLDGRFFAHQEEIDLVG
ncbi:MAG: glycosyltransferase family 2 protein, partial [Bacteroidaceae bacterium]|nr:glycosyltransferase family 2 protein [Bacteroidaceae bacterium]